MNKFIGILCIIITAQLSAINTHFLQQPLIPWPQEKYSPTALQDHLKDYSPKHNQSFVIIVPSFNNESWIKLNLDSIFNQSYSQYRVIYCNDASTDATFSLLENYLAMHNLHERVTVINREKNVGGLANIYDAVQLCKPHEVAIELDGDDWFKHRYVLELLNKVYDNPNIWFTFGHYENYPTGTIDLQALDLARYVPLHNYRHSMGWCSPLRTFYAWLFHLIKKEDLCDETGNMLRLSWDHAMMWPLCEMAAGRCMFIPDVLYVYNKSNALCDFKLYQPQQLAAARLVCRKKPYQPLPENYLPCTNPLIN